MRIIKECDDVYRVIAAEMLNIESCARYFDAAGKLLAEPQMGYPVITDPLYPGVEYTIQASFGYIYIPIGVSEDYFISVLRPILAQMEGLIPSTLKNNYQTLQMGYHTNVKVQSAANITTASKDNTTNIKRRFTTNKYHHSNERFCWMIRNISYYYGSPLDRSDEVAATWCSIAYDADDILIHEHLASVIPNEKDLRAAEWAAEAMRVKISGEFPSVYRLENELRGDTSQHISAVLADNLYAAEYDQLEFNEKAGVFCTRCKRRLYEEFYALMSPLDQPHVVPAKCDSICFSCAHRIRIRTASDYFCGKYRYIFRVRSPRTIYDEITRVTANDPAREDLYRCVIADIKMCNAVHKRAAISYCVIGDKYVSVFGLSSVIYGPGCKDTKILSYINCDALIL